MPDTDIADLGMPADLFDTVTEMVALREEDDDNSYSDYDFAHSVARAAYAYVEAHSGH